MNALNTIEFIAIESAEQIEAPVIELDALDLACVAGGGDMVQI
jgi:hypothetical protein